MHRWLYAPAARSQIRNGYSSSDILSDYHRSLPAPRRLVRNTHEDYFVANLDPFGGNSGSPVFNADTLTVERILVRGEQDFAPMDGCFVSMVCPPGAGLPRRGLHADNAGVRDRLASGV
ncbi:MAG: hypothetical protein GKR94_32545 [Gammaproteobacteria bacterium]|nr:hypothetical protein [Gammaproteobacteria bacterium]